MCGRTPVCCLVSVLLLVNIIVLALLQTFGPRIEIETEVVNLGVLPLGEIRTRTIPITNLGKSDLVISDVRLSCNCTKATIDKTTLVAGSTASLSVTLKGIIANGDGVAEVVVVSNDPTTPLSLVSFVYRADRTTYAQPSHVAFGRLRIADLPVNKIIRVHGVHSHWPEAMTEGERTLSARCEDPYVAIEVLSVQSELAVYRVTLSQDTPCGEFRSDLHIGSNAESGLVVPISGGVRGDFYSDPPSCDVTLGSPTDDGTSIKVIRRGARRPVHIKAIEVSPSISEFITVAPPAITDSVTSIRVLPTMIPSDIQWFRGNRFGYVFLTLESDGPQHEVRFRFPVAVKSCARNYSQIN
jgi:hypothetical protein